MKDIHKMKRDESISVEKQFGLKIRQLRQLAGISQEELSFRCGLHRNYVSDTERGNRNVSLRAIEQFAKGLEISMVELFRHL